MRSQIYRFGPYEFSPETGDLFKSGVRIRLQRQPQLILKAMLANPNQTISRQALQQELWPSGTFVDFEQGLNVAIKKLRNSLCDSAEEPRYIETIPGVGYRFIAELETARTDSFTAVAPGRQPAETPISIAAMTGGNNKSRLLASGRWVSSGPAMFVTSTIMVAGLIAALSMGVRTPRQSRPRIRSTISLPAEVRLVTLGDYAGLALSPDGTRVVFSATDAAGHSMLWMRRMDSLDPERVPGTDGAAFPFWSPDGTEVAFFTEQALKKVRLRDGVITELCASASGRGGTWSSRGVILYSPSTRDHLMRVDSNGGTPAAVTQLEEGKQSTHRWPVFLPDGNHFLFLAANHASTSTRATINLGDLDGSPVRQLVEADSNAFLVGDKLVFVSGGKLISRRLDLKTWEVGAEATVLSDAVGIDVGSWYGIFSANSETMVYLPQNDPTGRYIVAFDATGNRIQDISARGMFNKVSVAPKGDQVAAICGDPDMSVCLIYPDGTVTKLSASIISLVEWSPDSTRIAYDVHTGSSSFELRTRTMKQDMKESVLLRSRSGLAPGSWHPDGQHLLVLRDRGRDYYSIDVLEIATGKLTQYLSQVRGLRHARISPDGKWVAYDTEENGVTEVHIASYPAPATRYRVAAGIGPRWRRDGNELYFLGERRAICAVPVSSAGRAVVVGQPREMFRPPILPPPADRDAFDVDPTGKKFYVVTDHTGTNSELIVLSGWAS